MYDNSRSASKGRTHFSFTLGGVDYVFAYIRKNGCSAVTRMIAETSPYAHKRGKFATQYEFLRRRHKTPPDEAPDARFFFIYRDPAERVASLFVNKLVVKDGARNMVADITAKLGAHPDEICFEDFVTAYVCAHYPKVDKHCLAQAEHLRPVRYDAAIALGDLREGASALFGDEIAQRYFAEPRNRNPGGGLLGNAPRTPAGRLAESFLASGATPSYAALLTPRIRDEIAALYAEDYRMIAAIERSSEG